MDFTLEEKILIDLCKISPRFQEIMNRKEPIQIKDIYMWFFDKLLPGMEITFSRRFVFNSINQEWTPYETAIISIIQNIPSIISNLLVNNKLSVEKLYNWFFIYSFKIDMEYKKRFNLFLDVEKQIL